MIWGEPGPAGELPAAEGEQLPVWGNPAVAAVAENLAVAAVGILAVVVGSLVAVEVDAESEIG